MEFHCFHGNPLCDFKELCLRMSAALIKLGIKFDLVVMYVKVNPESSFVQTGQGLHSQCYIPCPKANGFLVSEKKFLKEFLLIRALWPSWSYRP